jgi:hypothetical protein
MKQVQLSLSADDKYRQARIQRSRHLDFIQETGLSSNKGTPTCRQHAAGAVSIKKGLTKTGKFRAYYGNLITCKSIWSCPVCAYGEALVRQERINNLLRDLPKTGAYLLFVTFTLQHNYKNSLDETLNLLNKSFKEFQQGSGYKSLQKQLELEGSIRVLEITHSHINGWHPHLHCVFVVDKETTPQFTKQSKELIFNRWESIVKRNGGFTNNLAIDVKRVYSDSPLSRYLSKLAQELTQGINKKGRNGSRTPFAILADLFNYEYKRPPCSCTYYKENETLQLKKKCDLCLWLEYETTMKGKKQIGFSGVRSLEKRCEQLEKESTQDEIDNMLYTSIEKFAELSNSTYNIIRYNKIANKILEIIETDGIPGFTKFMDTYQYETIDENGEVKTFTGLSYNLLAK